MVNEVERLESIGEELLEDSSGQDQNREEKLDQQFRILSKTAVKRRKCKPTGAVIYINYIIIGALQKRSTLPPRRKFLPSGGGGETKLFLIIVNVPGHPKGYR